jgi:hypothetical protein
VWKKNCLYIEISPTQTSKLIYDCDERGNLLSSVETIVDCTPMVPTIYVPPASRFTDRTPAAYPVLLRSLRAGIVLTIEWGTLHIMDRVPTWVAVGLTIDSLLILGVLESRNWLAFKGRYYFRYSLTALIMVYAAICIAPYFLSSSSPATAPPKEHFLSVGPPSSGKTVVGGPYLPEEINKMILAVGSLSDILHLEIKPTFDAAKSSIENWQQEVQSEGVPAFATRLSSSADKLASASKRIDEILSANTRYDSEIRLTVHDRDPGPFVRELGFFASDISKTIELPPQTREAILTNVPLRLKQGELLCS